MSETLTIESEVSSFSPTGSEKAGSSAEERLVDQGLHLDWLVRANLVTNLETLVYLAHQRDKWADEDQRVILTILQKYEASKKGLISANEPSQVTYRKRAYPEKFSSLTSESSDTVIFTKRFLRLVQEEPVIWDKINSPDFGYHQPMRQAWCSISLALGGWGAMQHVHMLKQFYRRKRDQYNIDHLRLGRPFQYSQELSFLKNVLEMAASGAMTNGFITIEEHVQASAQGIVYENEVEEAPEEIQRILKKVSETIDFVSEKYSKEALAEYLSFCCNDVVKSREEMATAGLLDHEWINPMGTSPLFDSSQSDSSSM